MHHPTDRITHITAFVTPVLEHWLESEIAQWVHNEGSIRLSIAPTHINYLGYRDIKLQREGCIGLKNLPIDLFLNCSVLKPILREREMFYLTTHSTHFIYSYMASDIWLRTILLVRKETRCRHIGYSYHLTARVLLHVYAPSHRQDNTYHGLCYTSRGALAGTRNSSMGPPHEGSIRRPTAP